MSPVPAKHREVEKDGYRLTFYPGFLSQGTLDVAGQQIVLYKQEGPDKPYRLGDGEPLRRCELRLQGGPNNRDFALTIDDPHHQVAQIVIKLKAGGQEAGPEGTAASTDSGETLTADNFSVTCPPDC